MDDIYFPGGLSDDPLLEGLQWTPRENGDFAQTDSGQPRGGARHSGVDIDMVAGYAMTRYQFNGIFLPWWLGRKRNGGCDNGASAFWMRDPFERLPFLWQRQQGQAMRPQADGTGFVVWLSLMRIAG